MKPGHTAKRGQVKSKKTRMPKAGTAHNRNVGGSAMMDELKRRARFDPGLADLSDVEKKFLSGRSDTPEDFQRATGVIKRVRKQHKKKGIKI